MEFVRKSVFPSHKNVIIGSNHLMIMNTTATPKVALVVDDEIVVCRALYRILKSSFDKVITTTSPEEAGRILTENRVTHLVCDCNLGEGLPLGFQFIPDWRKMCPTIERTVVFSGTDLSNKKMPEEVDVVLEKNAEPEALLKALIHGIHGVDR
jgi:CheY-like chemotaxis protein